MAGFDFIFIIVALAGVTGVAVAFYLLFLTPAGQRGEIRDLLASGRRRDEFNNRVDVDVDYIKRETEKKALKKKKGSGEDTQTKLFKAGYYKPDDRKRFLYAQIASPIISVVLCTIVMTKVGNTMMIVAGFFLGIIIGFTLPLSWLERKVRAREEEIMYFLPLVIEQISIGVSSALDVGPCISHILQMARERDTYNPVTEMFVHVEKLIISGLNLEDALVEVGEANGMTEVKHALMFLAQCARHGGEVSRQLQELADAVTVQRQVQVEGRITALPVKATFPLTCVFFGFFLILGAGIFIRLIESFGHHTRV